MTSARLATIATAFHAVMAWVRAIIGPREVALIIGISSTMHGLAMIYRPAAWIFVGLFTLWVIFRRTPK